METNQEKDLADSLIENYITFRNKCLKRTGLDKDEVKYLFDKLIDLL